MESLGDPVCSKDDKKAGETEGNFLFGFFSFVRVGGGGEVDEPGMNENEKQNETGNDEEIGKDLLNYDNDGI